MRKLLLTNLLTILNIALLGQDADTWTYFWNKDTTLIGFKDMNGRVKIEPKFVNGLMVANRFQNIVAVTEEVNKVYTSYYLTKNGRIVGRDSLYIFDNGADCESEGFIRFMDKKSDKVGMFNSKGEIAIPAEYDHLTRVTNGMVIALKDAEKKFWDKDKHAECNHFTWIGGKQLLIDTNNNVLVNNFASEADLNFFSLQQSHELNKDTIRSNFFATNGQYFSFIDFEKEFKQWLKVHLLEHLTKENLENTSFQEVSYWKEPNGWITVSNKEFMAKNFELIQKKLLEVKSGSCNYDIFDGGLNPLFFESAVFQRYFNNCNESKDWIYPSKRIVITHKNQMEILQDQFEFLRTDEGYKLIGVSIGKGKLK